MSLKARGLTGVEFIISDDHAGLVKAIGGSFAGATCFLGAAQPCQTQIFMLGGEASL